MLSVSVSSSSVPVITRHLILCQTMCQQKTTFLPSLRGLVEFANKKPEFAKWCPPKRCNPNQIFLFARIIFIDSCTDINNLFALPHDFRSHNKRKRCQCYHSALTAEFCSVSFSAICYPMENVIKSFLCLFNHFTAGSFFQHLAQHFVLEFHCQRSSINSRKANFDLGSKISMAYWEI